jgi:Rrf2 family nitric oxide-sensitive transcriptional repressor
MKEANVRLTAYSDFALRMLMYLAIDPTRTATIAEIAIRYGVSKNHLMKVAHDLGRAGYVETLRGKNGGLRLARSAREVGLGEVVRRAEPDMAIAPCFEPVAAHCPISPACRLRRALVEARMAFLSALDRYSLADLVENADIIGGLLGVETPV